MITYHTWRLPDAPLEGGLSYEFQSSSSRSCIEHYTKEYIYGDMTNVSTRTFFSSLEVTHTRGIPTYLLEIPTASTFMVPTSSAAGTGAGYTRSVVCQQTTEYGAASFTEVFGSSEGTTHNYTTYEASTGFSQSASVTRVDAGQFYADVGITAVTSSDMTINWKSTLQFSTKGSFGGAYFAGIWTEETTGTNSFLCWNIGFSSGTSSTKRTCVVSYYTKSDKATYSGTKWSYKYSDIYGVETHWDTEYERCTYDNSTTQVSCVFIGSTYKLQYAIAAESYDLAAVMSNVGGYYNTTTAVTKTATGYTAAGGVRITYSSTYTDFSSTNISTSVNKLVTSRTKTWGSQYFNYDASKRPVAECVAIIEHSDCVVTVDYSVGTYGYVAPGTYTAYVIPGNAVLGGDGIYFASGPMYEGGPGYSSSYSFGSYCTSTYSWTELGPTTLTRVSVTGGDAVPFDGRMDVTLPVGTTIQKQTTFTYSETTTSYSYSGNLGQYPNIPGFFSRYEPATPYPIRASDGGVEWVPSFYSNWYFSLDVFETYDTSDSASFSYTLRDVDTVLWSPYTTVTATYTDSTRTLISGIQGWGQVRARSSSMRTLAYRRSYAYSNSWYSNYPKLFFTGGENGFSFGESFGSNIDAQGGCNPVFDEADLGATRAYGARFPLVAAGATGSLDLGGVSYSTTYLGDGEFSFGNEGGTSVGTLVASGDGESHFFGVPYLASATRNGTTYAPATTYAGWLPGDVPHDRTITFNAPIASSWNSYGAWDYTSINTVAGGTTTGVTQYSPAVNPQGTTMSLGSECAIILSTASAAITSTYFEYRTYDSLTYNQAFSAADYITYDMWKY